MEAMSKSNSPPHLASAHILLGAGQIGLPATSPFEKGPASPGAQGTYIAVATTTESTLIHAALV